MSELALPLAAPAALRPAKLCSDAQLARRAARGDQRAFAEIFERHHQAVYRYCRSILGNGEDAADALQNTMASVLRGLDGETRDIALKPWLFRIAHNEALSILRRSRPQAELDDAQPCTRSGVEARVLASERLRQVVADVQALPDRQRGALIMRELNGLEYAEIAAVFGVAEGAARQAVHEARTMLHALSEGRAMACADVRDLISARDGRLLRGRRVRAHLRACEPCAQFRAAIGQRQTALAMAAPPLAAPVAASLLSGLLGGGHGGATATAAAGGGVTAAASVAPIAHTAAVTGLSAKAAGTAGLATKAVAVLAATATLGGGAVVAEQQINPDRRPGRPAVRSLESVTSGKPAGPGVATGVVPTSGRRSATVSTTDRPSEQPGEGTSTSRRRAGATSTPAAARGANPSSKRPATAATRPSAASPARRPSSAATAPSTSGAGSTGATRRHTSPEQAPSTSATRPTTPTTSAPPAIPTSPHTTQSRPQVSLPAVPEPDPARTSPR